MVRLDTSLASTSMPPRRAMATTARSHQGSQERREQSGVGAELLAPRFCGPSLHRPCRSPHRYRCTTLVIRACADLRAPVVAVTVAPRALRLCATLLGATARRGLPVQPSVVDAGRLCRAGVRAAGGRRRRPGLLLRAKGATPAQKALTCARCCRGLSILLPAKQPVGFGISAGPGRGITEPPEF